MKITVIGRGNVGGGLAARWRRAGHDVTELGSDGGDASGSDAVLVAIPSSAIGDGFTKVTGIGDAVVIDATNAFTGREEGFDSLAHQIKSHVGGPVAKSFTAITPRSTTRSTANVCGPAPSTQPKSARSRSSSS
jgi:hypothetical protein